MKRWSIAVWALIVAPSFADAGTIRDDRLDSQYTNLAGDPLYQSVGLLRYTPTNSVLNGVLITPGWVLTAGHVATGVGSTTPLPASDFQFELPGGPYSVAEVIVAPGWVTSNADPLQGSDIALMRLTTPIFTVTPAVLYAGSSEVGNIATYVGFGLTGTGLTGGQSNTQGTKRAGNNSVDITGASAGLSANLLLADFDSPTDPSRSTMGSATPLNLEYSLAVLDSGGGTFIDFGSGPELVGIHSAVLRPTLVPAITGAFGKYGDISSDTRVSGHIAWINSVIPEPSSVALVGVGAVGALAAAIRRRRT